jgi:hypothetical protein
MKAIVMATWGLGEYTVEINGRCLPACVHVERLGLEQFVLRRVFGVTWN